MAANEHKRDPVKCMSSWGYGLVEEKSVFTLFGVHREYDDQNLVWDIANGDLACWHVLLPQVHLRIPLTEYLVIVVDT